MSDNVSIDYQHKLLYSIIRNPQEGKTFICLENIRQNSNCLHIIMTMNTIKSNNQFFHRAKNEFPNRLCVFNSKANKQEINTYTHCKQLHQLLPAINKNGKEKIRGY